LGPAEGAPQWPDRRAQIPIAPLTTKRSRAVPRVPSLEACGRRPPCQPRRQRPAGIHNPSHERKLLGGAKRE
jgi:hypothetical protein